VHANCLRPNVFINNDNLSHHVDIKNNDKHLKGIIDIHSKNGLKPAIKY
jgi:hypothetical protein